MNIENLKKLSEYLKTIDDKGFDMGYFTDNKNNEDSLFCGTVGCAIGHGPYAGIKKMNNESWHKYGQRAFSLYNYEWEWCFSSHWEKVDNSSFGAAKRIDVLLSSGLPLNCSEQMYGREKLCYEVLRVGV